MPPVNPSADAAELARREETLRANEAAFAERQRKIRATEDDAFVSGIVAAGRLPKVLGPAAVALFAELGEDTLEFGEGEAAQSTTPRAAFRDLLSRLPAPVAEGELAGGADEALDFSDPAVNAGLIRTEIADAKAKGEEISSAQAIGRLKQRAAK